MKEPYLAASQAIRQGEDAPIHALKNIGLTALGGAAAGAVSKLVPAIGSLISKYVPDKFSIEGLKKIDPRFGNLIQGAMDSGYSYDDVRNFMGQKIEESQSKEKIPDKKNIIEQRSPELHQFIDQELKKGRPLLQAGALAQMEGKATKNFKSIIEKLEKDHKTPWSSILEAVYGGTQSNAQSVPPASQQNTQHAQAPQQNQSSGQSQFAQELKALLNS